ncbi:MAG TPA: ABC transporter ATP-binding protein [Hypericibacter adhaerens]|jgi:branched-chain amino acid transport system ATP-binding protein|uniref:ABC transporter ATP-binding protein n=1 Tax=Hypericibacter adhaerens TaxID=2602016 RepID=A0A5J6MS89_9PROT|nr:ABC transporter ATP-binding protein [Hypericibacter adhaerens]QEX20482.1 ABC transporter ATP-binding protein [Hypericibacter adhaerens]HWA46127.1 ABC transporter ATP-binding protein [Hypericibacter adhaerens]
MAEALLKIDNLSAGYHGQDVLRGLSLSIAEGGLVAIVGPNGHGKSTLLRAISGLLRLTGGSIELEGKRIDRLRPDQIVAAGIVHVPQGDLLFPEMTVLENLQMGAYLPAAASQMAERLEQVYALLPKLKDRRSQVASTLSGGERRMVGIGRGLMADARVMLLDEPSLGLAPIIIDQIYEVIDALRRSGRTILLVEENASRVADKADHIHLLDHGEFVWSGAGSALMARPEILATYLGS